jgi:hypothetical protein
MGILFARIVTHGGKKLAAQLKLAGILNLANGFNQIMKNPMRGFFKQ